MPLDTVLISTCAALGGSAIGALAPILSNYVIQRGQTRRELLNRQIAGRETLYAEFIQESARVYAHSMTHNLEEAKDVVNLYSLVAKMRLISSDSVINAAEHFGHQIIVHYGEPNLDIEQMRAAALQAEVDPLKEFSIACRTELRQLFERGEESPLHHVRRG